MHTKQKQKKNKYEKLKVISLEFMGGRVERIKCTVDENGDEYHALNLSPK